MRVHFELWWFKSGVWSVDIVHGEHNHTLTNFFEDYKYVKEDYKYVKYLKLEKTNVVRDMIR